MGKSKRENNEWSPMVPLRFYREKNETFFSDVLRHSSQAHSIRKAILHHNKR